MIDLSVMKKIQTRNSVNSFSNLLTLLFILFYNICTYAQTAPGQLLFIDIQELDKYRSEYGIKKTINPVKKYLASADKLLTMKPLSVAEKEKTPPGGDKHDFMSIAPYWWPDPSKPDGLPYIRRDGERNPEYLTIKDQVYLNETINAVEILTNAYYITQDDKYSRKAIELLRIWLIDNNTRMNPNLKYAQFVPGLNEGRGAGIIVTRYISKFTDAVILLRKSDNWSKKDDDAITRWFEEFFIWLTTHKYGIDESNAANNHGTWYDVQVAGIAIFLGKYDTAKRIAEEAKTKRIDKQIEPDGKQPLELERTRSWNYSAMNLSAFMHLAILGDYVGVDLWNYSSESGASIRKALDYLLPFIAEDADWEYKQIVEIDKESLIPLLLYAKEKYDAKTYEEWIIKIFKDKPPQKIIGEKI